MDTVIGMLGSLESCANKQGRFLLDNVLLSDERTFVEPELNRTKRYIRVRTKCDEDPDDVLVPGTVVVNEYLDPGPAELDQWRRATTNCRNPMLDSSGSPVTHKFASRRCGPCVTRAHWVAFDPETRRWEKTKH